ncbi:MAG TPA: protein kinase [Verrucomicrobiae bacterium]|nr:protein kinase [Verrucomicrobiae bacterium]
MPANSTALVCPECGAALGAAGASGLCPRCLLAVGLDEVVIHDPLLAVPHSSAGLANSAFRPLPAFGDYELLEEIARGGMGVVYKARQKSLNRLVAIKMLLAGPFASPEYLSRFRAEAETAAKLRHPNIVSIIEVGQHEGLPYFSMDYVDGPNLTELVQDGPLEAKRAAACMQTLATTIHYAHTLGVLHRDLKPANVLVDMFEQPRVTDFGLAKLLAGPHQASVDAQLTLTGQMLGSPAFMAPEQAAADATRIAATSDIYSLGAILYWLLTCRPPHLCASLAETVRAVKEDEPVRPHELNRAIPLDLETICLKCLQKDSLKRYPTAEALAEDLARFLGDEPILARPIGTIARVWRWCRRKPLVAALFLALNMAFALGLAGVSWQWRRAELNALSEAREHRRADAEKLGARQHQYVSDINRSKMAWDDGDLAGAQTLLKAHIPGPHEPDLRGFEWRYLWKLCSDESQLSFTNFSERVTSVAVSPDGSLAAASSGATIKLFNLHTGREVGTLQSSTEEVVAIAFCPKATNILAAASTETVQLWDMAAKKVIDAFDARPRGPGSYSCLGSLTFSPNGQLLAVGSGVSVTLTVRDIEHRTNLWTRSTRVHVSTATFTPDGEHLISGGGDVGNPVLWDLATGQAVEFPPEHKGWVNSAAVSPDGRTVASGANDGRVILWDLASRRPRAILLGHNAEIDAVALSPVGNLLVTGSGDNTLRLWDVSQGRQLAVLRGHQSGITSLTFTPDGKNVVSSSWDHTVKVWELAKLLAPPDIMHANDSWVSTIAFSPDAAMLATVSYHEPFSTKIWDVATRQLITELSGHTRAGLGALFSPDGRTLATSGADRTIRLWDVSTFRSGRAPTVPTILTNDFESGHLSFSADSAILAIAGDMVPGSGEPPNRLAFWDLSCKKRLNVPPGAGNLASSVAFSTHGSMVAVRYRDGRLTIWDFRTGAIIREFHDPVESSNHTAFSHDDSLLATTLFGLPIVLHDLADPSGGRGWLLKGHASIVWYVDFMPDGKTLVSSGDDGTLKFWNLATHEVALTLKGHLGAAVFAVAQNGNLIASSGADGTVRFWRATPVEEMPKNTLAPDVNR